MLNIVPADGPRPAVGCSFFRLGALRRSRPFPVRRGLGGGALSSRGLLMAGLPWFKAYAIARDPRALALAGKLRRPHAWIHVAALRYWLAEKAPTGTVTGSNAAEIIEGAACWDGEPGA